MYGICMLHMLHMFNTNITFYVRVCYKIQANCQLSKLNSAVRNSREKVDSHVGGGGASFTAIINKDKRFFLSGFYERM